MLKKYKNAISLAVVLIVFLFGCKKDGEMYTLKDGVIAADGLSASSKDVVLTMATENDTAVTFSWSPADFGEKPAIRYTLQLAKQSDDPDANGWGNAKTFVAGNNITRYGFVGKDLNNLLGTMGVNPGTATDFLVRVKAELPQFDGSASHVTPVYTAPLSMKITSYNLVMYIPGEFQGWNPGTAPELNPVAGRPGLYEAYVFMPGSGPKYFKYTNARDWNHTNYGDGGNGTFSTDGLAAGLSVPDGGYYEVTADLNTNRWTATKTTWSIVGDATPGGWNSDTQMIYDEVAQVWRVTCDMVSNGSFKFRANNAWVIDFGMDPDTKKLVYADNPFFGYTPGLWNFAVPENGNYTITLDLHVSQHYTYGIVKN